MVWYLGLLVFETNVASPKLEITDVLMVFLQWNWRAVVFLPRYPDCSILYVGYLSVRVVRCSDSMNIAHHLKITLPKPRPITSYKVAQVLATGSECTLMTGSPMGQASDQCASLLDGSSAFVCSDCKSVGTGSPMTSVTYNYRQQLGGRCAQQ